MENKILSKLSAKLVASEIVRLGATIKQKIKQGASIYNYTIGDFSSKEFPIPALLEEKIIEAYKDGYTTYPSAEGELDLREAVADFLNRNLDLPYKADEILIAAGGRPLIYALYRCIVDAGDKVIYPVPSWNNNHYSNFTGAEHVIIEATKENNFLPTAEQIKEHISGATLLALCSPLNPTGTSFNKEDLEKICDLVLAENEKRGADEKKLYMMYDQIYWTLTFGDTVHYNPVTLRPAMKDYCIFVDGISKAFAATGVRVGWSMGPKSVIEKMRSLNSHIGSWAPMAEQKAVAGFLNDEAAVNNFLKDFKKDIAERLQGFYEGFINLKSEGFDVDAIEPQAAIYLTVSLNLTGQKTSEGLVLETQEAVTEYLLNDCKLALVPFTSFGVTNKSSWYRLSVGTCKLADINLVLNNLKNSLAKLS